VVDFGLACEAEDAGSVTRRRTAGTPGFIAPELAAGAPVTAAADQYSFCVALASALADAADAPGRRILAAVARGRAPDPAQRFASMPELLRVLARDPAARRRRIAAASVVAACVGIAAFALGRGVDEEPCSTGAQRIAAVWPERDAALARVAGLGGYGASLRPLLERELAAHTRRWIAEDRAACRAGRDGTQSDLMSERRLACVRRGSDALAAVRMLVEAADGDRLFELPRAVQAMPDPAACGDRELLSLEVARPPAMLAPRIAELRQILERARVLIGAGRYEPAQAVAHDAVAQARPLGYPPLLAEALLVEGHAAMNRDREAALPMLVEATRVALGADAYAVAIEAWARRAWAQGTLRGPAEALAGLDVVEPLARRAPAFVRALLFNNVGSVNLADGRIADARGWLARARTEARLVAGAGALELLSIEFNLAVASPDLAQADALIGEAIDQLTTRLGAEHPDTLTLRQERTMVAIEALRRIDAELARVCAAEAAYPDMAGKNAACWSELAQVRWDLGRRDDARAAFTQARRLDKDSRELAATARLVEGDAAGAAGLLAAALGDLAPRADDPWWIRAQRGRLALGLGRAQRALGRPDAARRSLERAVVELRAVTPAHPAAIFARWLGRAQRELVSCLGELGDPTGGPEAPAAAAWQRRVGLAGRAPP
jgi:tetratricopeptide (TPR) repeat protein